MRWRGYNYKRQKQRHCIFAFARMTALVIFLDRLIKYRPFSRAYLMIEIKFA